MNSRLKSAILGTRYWLTLPRRRWQMRRMCAAGEAPAMILFYHRVADDHPNDWTISNGLFQKQMDWIRKRFEIVSLADVQKRRESYNFKPTVSITFDDGYADNCVDALPFLIRHRIPCTYFVTLDNIVHNKPFPHDLEAGKPLSPNTIEQIKWMAQSGIEIGAHTKTHPNIGKITDPAVLQEEIVYPKHKLESILGKPVRYFAFPFGLPANMTQQAVQTVYDAGYLGFCSAYGSYNLRGHDPFHLQRIHGDPDMIQLKNWLSFDDRKLRITRPFEFHLETAHPSESTTYEPASAT